MKLVIEYEASWRNSFLDGSNNEPLPRRGRNFIATTSSLKKETFFEHSVSKDTVMGLLNRLVGDQRKLYQSRKDENYYFKDIESVLEAKDILDEPKAVSDEVVYLRNVGDGDDRNSFAGLIKDDVPIFKSSYAGLLWGVLWLNHESLSEFILNSDYVVPEIHDIGAMKVKARAEEIGVEDSIKVRDADNYNRALNLIKVFQKELPDYKCDNSEKPIKYTTLYFSALYLQIERLRKLGLPVDDALTKQKKIPGISANTFTPKDFLGKFGGGKKKAWGGPYLFKERVKGEGEVSHKLTKQSGILTIILRVSKERAEDLKQKIEDAAVGPFYLGKKGLAYVAKIDTRENI